MTIWQSLFVAWLVGTLVLVCMIAAPRKPQPRRVPLKLPATFAEFCRHPLPLRCDDILLKPDGQRADIMNTAAARLHIKRRLG